MLRITWKQQKNPVSPEPVKRPVASCELSTYYIVLEMYVIHYEHTKKK